VAAKLDQILLAEERERVSARPHQVFAPVQLFPLYSNSELVDVLYVIAACSLTGGVEPDVEKLESVDPDQAHRSLNHTQAPPPVSVPPPKKSAVLL
jgi:hypothetical protein